MGLLAHIFSIGYPHAHLFLEQVIKHDKTLNLVSILLLSLKFRVALQVEFREGEGLWISCYFFRVSAKEPQN